MEAKLVPYLSFNGEASEVLDFYQSIFGGEVTKITFGDFKAVESDSPLWGQIMHGNLVGGLVHLCASDSPEEMTQQKLVRGNTITLAWMGDDSEKLTEIFTALADGGQVGTALNKQMWGDTYGDLVDKFGVQWMVDIYETPEGE